MKRIQLFHYLVLLGILGGGVWTFFFVAPNVTLQLLVGLVTVLGYIFWGVIHHIIQKDLHHKIVIEYILIGAIALVLLVTMLGF